MSKTVVDIDPEMLEQAKHALGTTTIKDTVAQALALVVDRQAKARQELIRWLASSGLPGYSASGFAWSRLFSTRRQLPLPPITPVSPRWPRRIEKFSP